MLAPWKENYDKPRQQIKKQRQNFADKVPYSQSYGFPSIHVRMWELVNKGGWALKNQCFWTLVLEKTLESPLNCKEFKWVSSKRTWPWILIGRTDAEDPIIDHLMQRADSLGKTQRKAWRQKEKRWQGMRWLDFDWLNEHEFEQTLGDSQGHRSLACYSPLNHKELNTTETE